MTIERPSYGADISGLHLAAYNGDVAAVRELLEAGAIVDQRDAQGFTPLLWACFRAGVGESKEVGNFLAAVVMLIDAGADIHAETGGKLASNCLMLAVGSGNVAVVRELLRRGVPIDAAVEGMTALMTAADSGDLEVALVLLDSGANPHLRCGTLAPSDYARRWGYDDLAGILNRVETNLEKS